MPEPFSYEADRALEEFGMLVEQKMREKKLLVADVAERTGLTAESVREILRGHVDIDIKTMVDIAFAVDCGIDMVIRKSLVGQWADRLSKKGK